MLDGLFGFKLDQPNGYGMLISDDHIKTASIINDTDGSFQFRQWQYCYVYYKVIRDLNMLSAVARHQ